MAFYVFSIANLSVRILEFNMKIFATSAKLPCVSLVSQFAAIMKIGMGFALWICLLHTIIGLSSEVPRVLLHLK
jgi:hypothetical protein